MLAKAFWFCEIFSNYSNNSYFLYFRSRCETYTTNDTPTKYNKRSECREILYEEEIFLSEPWFGIEQKFSIKTKNEFSRQSFVEAFYRICLHAGLKICSANSMKNQCNFQIGPCVGITFGDDLWMSRFLLKRLAEKLEMTVTLNFE